MHEKCTGIRACNFITGVCVFCAYVIVKFLYALEVCIQLMDRAWGISPLPILLQLSKVVTQFVFYISPEIGG